MKKMIFLYILLIPMTYANSASPEIIQWDEITVQKGFILSTYLENERFCRKTWRKQAPLWMEKNPHVRDPDEIPVGTVIQVQLCKNTTGLNIQEEIKQPKEILVQADEYKKEKEKPKEEIRVVKKEYEPREMPFLHVFGGFINEKDKDDVDLVLGVGLTAMLYKNVGYKINMLAAESVGILSNELRFKQSERERRYFIGAGFGTRFGLKNKDLNRLNKGLDSYSYLSVGMEVEQEKFRYEIDLGVNLARTFAPNIGIHAQKKYGETWIGTFLDYKSTLSTDDSGKDRRYLTGGLKFSF